MKASKIPNERPQSPSASVTLKVAGNIMEIRYARSNLGSPIRKVDANHGLDVRTGELIEYQHKTNRAESKEDVAQSMKRLRDLINTSLVHLDSALWITLTRSENMTDTVQLYEDYRRLWQKFRYYLKKQGHPDVEYIVAAEPQGRGACTYTVYFCFHPDGRIFQTPTLPGYRGIDSQRRKASRESAIPDYICPPISAIWN